MPQDLIADKSILIQVIHVPDGITPLPESILIHVAPLGPMS